MASTEETLRSAVADNFAEIKSGLAEIRDKVTASQVHQGYILAELSELKKRLDHIEPHAAQLPDFSARLARSEAWIQRADGFVKAWTIIGPIVGGIAGFVAEKLWKG